MDTDRADRDGEAYFNFFDADSRTLADYGAVLFDLEEESLTIATRRALGWTDDQLLGHAFVIIDKVAIVKEWQGKNLGALFVNRVLELVGKGYNFVAIEPFPMQFGAYRDDEVNPPSVRAHAAVWRAKHIRDSFATSEAEATKRIARYWKRHGFVRVGKSSIWVRPLGTHNA